ncbi:MAG: hypothetical protein JWL94_1043 [Microbacteriaceae bacterium]|nr:hypothetical protein [Microbacteriaceae bacterium]HEV7956940.1 hypothetical protein [Marisediminicola sp.]
MRGKLVLVAGLAVGYVLGSRAGRGRYEQIAKAADRFWNKSSVQRQVHQVEDFAKDRAPEVVDFVTGRVRKAANKAAARKSSTGSTDSSSSTGSSSTENSSPTAPPISN